MKEHFTIGELARAAGIPTSTLRYYEREGLLIPEARSMSNYRLYGRASLERLRFIRAAQANGFSLEDVAALLKARDTRGVNHEVRALIARRLAGLELRAQEIRRVRSALETSLERCQASELTGSCAVLDELKQRSTTSAVGASASRRRPARKPPSRL